MYKFARRKDSDVSQTSIKVVTKRYDVTEFEDRAFGFTVGRFTFNIAHRLCRHALNADTRISTGSPELRMSRAVEI